MLAKKEILVKFSDISGFVAGLNTRNAIPTLSQLFYCVFESENRNPEHPLNSLVSMVIGEKATEHSRKEFCKLIEAHEEGLKGLSMTFRNPTIGMQDAIQLSQVDKHDYRLVDGCRRFLASLLIWAEDGCSDTDNYIRATLREGSVDENKVVSVIKNLQRKDCSPMEKARIFHEWKTTHKSAKTGKRMSDKEIAAELLGRTTDAACQEVGYFRQFVFLSASDQRALEDGTLSVSKAKEKVSKKTPTEPAGLPPAQSNKRRKTMEYKKAIELLKDDKTIAEKIADKGYDPEAVKFGMRLLMGGE